MAPSDLKPLVFLLCLESNRTYEGHLQQQVASGKHTLSVVLKWKTHLQMRAQHLEIMKEQLCFPLIYQIRCIKMAALLDHNLSVSLLSFVYNPNILGGFDAIRYTANNTEGEIIQDGAIKTGVGYKNGDYVGGAAVGSCRYDFDASVSNSVYTGTTLKPNSLSVLVLLRL